MSYQKIGTLEAKVDASCAENLGKKNIFSGRIFATMNDRV